MLSFRYTDDLTMEFREMHYVAVINLERFNFCSIDYKINDTVYKKNSKEFITALNEEKVWAVLNT